MSIKTLSSSPEVQKQTISRVLTAAVVAKILLVVALAVALAVAAFFTGGLAVPLFAVGLFSAKTTLCAAASIGFGMAALASFPVAGSYNMYKETNRNLQDCIRYLGAISVISLLGGTCLLAQII